jgi:hypothetical protein
MFKNYGYALLSSVCLVFTICIILHPTHKSKMDEVAPQVNVIDHNLYATIKQEISIASYYPSTTYSIITRIWVGEKQHILSRMSIEYREEVTASLAAVDSVANVEYAKAAKYKIGLDESLKKINQKVFTN